VSDRSTESTVVAACFVHNRPPSLKYKYSLGISSLGLSSLWQHFTNSWWTKLQTVQIYSYVYRRVRGWWWLEGCLSPYPLCWLTQYFQYICEHFVNFVRELLVNIALGDCCKWSLSLEEMLTLYCPSLWGDINTILSFAQETEMRYCKNRKDMSSLYFGLAVFCRLDKMTKNTMFKMIT
jgi:hypothetical protein